MASNFPTSVDNPTQIVDGTTDLEAVNMNTAYDSLTATQTMIGASGAAQSHNVDILTYLSYTKPPQLSYSSTSSFDVLAGTIAIKKSDGSIKKLRRNTASVNVTASNLDTGAMAVGYYYVYAVADAASTTFTVKLSTSATTPSGVTNYELIGWFYNETAGVLDITKKFFGNVKANGRDVPNAVIRTGTTDDTLNDTTYGSDVTESEVRFYSSGRPVLITANFDVTGGTGGIVSGIIDIDGTDKAASEKSIDTDGSNVLSDSVNCIWLETLSAGTHTITLQAKTTTGSNTIDNKVITVIEL